MLLPENTARTVLLGLGIVILLAIGRFFIRLYQVRTGIRDVTKKYGVVSVPRLFSFFFFFYICSLGLLNLRL